jgi:hypothetical protein
MLRRIFYSRPAQSRLHAHFCGLLLAERHFSKTRKQQGRRRLNFRTAPLQKEAIFFHAADSGGRMSGASGGRHARLLHYIRKSRRQKPDKTAAMRLL